MTDSEITTTILRQIRDEIIATRTELKAEISATRSDLTAAVAATNERLDVTNERLDVTNERLGVVETVVRDAALQVAMIGRYIKNKQDPAIDDLRERVSRLEEKVG